jgi:hypothetical protein
VKDYLFELKVWKMAAVQPRRVMNLGHGGNDY